jgi:transposase
MLLGVEHLVFEDGDVEPGPRGGEVLVLRVRPDHAHRHRCSRCGRRARRYDSGDGRRRWRALDAGVMACFLEADAPRVACPVHGVVAAAVPWARPGSRFTAAFEDQEGRNQDTLRAFFDDLGEKRAGLLTHVSADGAEWIHTVVRERAPQAAICLDSFHVVKWATEALGRLRRRLAAELKAGGKNSGC